MPGNHFSLQARSGASSAHKSAMYNVNTWKGQEYYLEINQQQYLGILGILQEKHTVWQGALVIVDAV